LGVPHTLFKRPSSSSGRRKDDVALKFLAGFGGNEGVLFIGRAQEETAVFRTEKRHNPTTGATDPWTVRATAMVNHFYVYAVDAGFGFGPFFIKFYRVNIVVMRHQLWASQCQGNGRHFCRPRDRAIPALSRVAPFSSVESVPNQFEGGFGTGWPLPMLAATAAIGLTAGLDLGRPHVLH
jgi:hypothetical protein